jgi:hypothetical protein
VFFRFEPVAAPRLSEERPVRRDDFDSTFGGMLFLIVFLVVAVVILIASANRHKLHPPATERLPAPSNPATQKQEAK